MADAEVNLNDSDCLIQGQEISCITLDDSHEDLEEGELNDGGKEEDEDVICEIKFTSTNYQKYGDTIAELLKEKLNNGTDQERQVEVVTERKLENVVTLSVRFQMHPDLGPDEQPNMDAFEREDSPDLTGISELFTIDTTPAVKLDSVKVPSYKRAVKDALLDGEAAASKKQKQEEKNMKVSKSNNCFNCGESDHNIRDCPMPHNMRRIKMAKKNFSKTERYHVDVEQRFAHLRPGVVSDKLREAMGLRKGELPFFFYRMRVLGYPPGWLEDAKVEHSGINLFNSDVSKKIYDSFGYWLNGVI